MSNQKSRKYEQRKRAEDVADTRRRITEAAVELHGSVGPARTTMSAVAERAGVQRQTLYRHFPDEEKLFAACSSHYWMEHPFPDPAPWKEISDPKERLRTALDELYGHYDRTEQMMANVFRDAELVASIPAAMAPLRSYQRRAVDLLAAGWPANGAQRRLVRAAIRHAIDFRTWQSLVHDGRISRAQGVALSTAMVESAATPSRRR